MHDNHSNTNHLPIAISKYTLLSQSIKGSTALILVQSLKVSITQSNPPELFATLWKALQDFLTFSAQLGVSFLKSLVIISKGAWKRHRVAHNQWAMASITNQVSHITVG